ncbi:lamin tail domain-containing protein [Dermabacter vaginalis]|uniref:Cell wall protein n=1 Tax=Dermabacter vaginalis TaxID=1630135 RepID=A0ABX6A6A8_9MICO|nr:lamin tail domain-containing protein [Dermabacter vaginalis]QEU12323.1 cell wall protein [Dermabacter vaginalis]
MTPQSRGVRRTPGIYSKSLAAAALGVTLVASPAIVPAGIAPSALTAAEAAPASTWPLVVTEIAPNNAGSDHYEYFEVTNTTDKPLTIGEGGYSFAYIYEDSDSTTKDVTLAPEKPIELAAGETVTLWLSYTSDDGKVDSSAHTVEEFRTQWGMDASARVERVTGQKGMANGGNRGIRVLDSNNKEVSRSFYPKGSVAEDKSAQFRTPADSSVKSLEVLEGPAAPTAGKIDPAQLEDRKADSQPEEPAEPEPEENIPGPAADTTVGQLLITELVPDSTNTGKGDGYEFIEIYNPTTQAIDLSDYQIAYQYPGAGRKMGNQAVWPMEPDNKIVEPGGTVIVWIKNGHNDDKTVEDFAANYGVDAQSLDIVESHVGGMANGSLRGMEIQTRTGHTVSRVFYNEDGNDDTQADQGIHYKVNPDNFMVNEISEISKATPGQAAPAKVPSEPVKLNDDTEKPVLEDHTAKSFDPSKDAEIKIKASDNVQVRRLTVSLQSNTDDKPMVKDLLASEDGTFSLTIPQADLTGKEYFEYSVLASDGTNTANIALTRVSVDGADKGPVRLNVTEKQYVGGTTRLSVSTDNASDQRTLAVDGTEVEANIPSLEKEPVFGIDATQTDAFFRNGVLVKDEVLTIFDQGFYENWVTVSTPIPHKYITKGEGLQVDVAAGTKAKPGIDPNENNDDFNARNARLVLPDGRTLRAANYDGANGKLVEASDPEKIIQMGDSSGKVEILNAKFMIPDDAYTANAYQWDTTKVADGEHKVLGKNAAGDTVETTVIVDNTAPTITSSIEDGSEQRGEFTVNFEATDTGSGVASTTATFDGKPIENGAKLSSLTLAAGEHTLTIVSTDKLGNESTKKITFTTPVEQPSAALAPENGTGLNACVDDSVSATATDPSKDNLTVSFREGYTTSLSEGTLSGTAGSVHDANQAGREGEALKSGETTTASDALPFHEFATAVPKDADENSEVRVSWNGVSNKGQRVRLLVWNTEKNGWEEVAHTLTDAESGEAKLEAMVPLKGHSVDGEIKAIVQQGIGYAGANLSDRSGEEPGEHADDTPRSDYDYTFAVETDTQYYNDDEKIYHHQVAIHDYLLRVREKMNLQYLFHTGDIVDKIDNAEGWVRADETYKELDDAKLPYGVLAGNHDVGHHNNDYSKYYEYFGKDRYENNPWYGGSYKNNRGHYDLVSAGGQDYIILYMGWGPGDDEIKWMNDVLAQYPERIAFIELHEYMLTTGGLGPIPQRIYDEVIATNPNVRAVMSGHYHDAHTRVDEFDDNGDGTPDRTVTQMLFDYQGLPEGGQGYLRLMHFDNEQGRMTVRTYSPSLKDYDSEDESFEPIDQEFEVSYEALGLSPEEKTLTTTDARIDVLTTKEFGVHENVASGDTVSVPASALPEGDFSWYTLTTDPYGAKHYSEVRNASVTNAECGDGGGTTVDPDGKVIPGKGSEPGTGGSTGSGKEQPGEGSHGSDASSVARPAKPSHGLPRTGAEVAGILAAGFALVAGGIAILRSRRFSR